MTENETIFEQIESDNIDRDFIFDTYQALGETVDKKGLNHHERRAATYQQYFTPYPVVKFITQALQLDTLENTIVLDNSCGIGRMFRYLHPTTRILGIEKEEQAYKVASALFPDAQIIQDDLIEHVLEPNTCDFALLNPPFSIRLTKRSSGIYNAQWGELGPDSSVESHIAAIEIGLRAARMYVAVIVPSSFFTNESTRLFEKWIKNNAKEIMRIELPVDVYAGAKWPTTLLVYDPSHWNHIEYVYEDTFKRTVTDMRQLDGVLREWQQTEVYTKHIANMRQTLEQFSTELTTLTVSSAPTAIPVTAPKLPLTGDGRVHMCLNPTNSKILLKSSDLLTALKVKRYQDGLGKLYNNCSKRYVSQWWIAARRPASYYGEGVDDTITPDVTLQHEGCSVTRSAQIADVRTKAVRWLELQQAPFAQWIDDQDEGWIQINTESNIQSQYPTLYKQNAKKLDAVIAKYPILEMLWKWQQHDIVQLSMKQHALLASDMGLGKTIEIISIALLHNCKHNLVVTEAKLIGQFAGELKRIGIPYKIIDKYHDTKDLAKFNLIAYSKIWRKASPGKTFAKALKKRCHFVALDEAHNIKANDSKRALACRSMHPKHWLLSSGTPISNYPRNLFSLLVCALGDGTELNPYGYWTPYIGGSSYQCTSGTRQFREDFVTVSSYVSNQFDDTLDKGRCIREFPIIKDVPKWHDMLAPVMLRRCQDEPEVRAEVKIPEPEVHDVYVDPSQEHIAFYDLWLNTFAEWYQAQLDEEEAGGHSMDIIQLLVQLGKLQFISTIPQADKVKSDKTVQYNWTAGITNKQEKIIELAKRHIARGEKTIVYSERPDLLKLLSKLFKQRGIKNALFTGEQSITKRDKNLIDFKVNGTNLLLATTTCGGVGLNIPQASTIIFADQNYSPKITDQAIHRILRPQQKGTPTVYKLYSAGFIDEYLKQMQDVKAMGIDEAIDYKEHTFDPSQWLNMRDFTAKYLKDKGLL